MYTKEELKDRIEAYFEEGIAHDDPLLVCLMENQGVFRYLDSEDNFATIMENIDTLLSRGLHKERVPPRNLLDEPHHFSKAVEVIWEAELGEFMENIFEHYGNTEYFPESFQHIGVYDSVEDYAEEITKEAYKEQIPEDFIDLFDWERVWNAHYKTEVEVIKLDCGRVLLAHKDK